LIAVSSKRTIGFKVSLEQVLAVTGPGLATERRAEKSIEHIPRGAQIAQISRQPGVDR
jgi:hypothetical protein